MEKRPRIVVLGGGTGTFTVLSGLKHFDVDLSAVVTMSDDGGSTGELRDAFGVLPPGDIRQCLVALSEGDAILRKVMMHRFPNVAESHQNSSVGGHNLGNLLLTGLEQICGDPLEAVRQAHRILRVRGNVIPVSGRASTLHAELSDRSIVVGEHAIDESVGRASIARCFLEPRMGANPDAINAILEADLIILGPGDLFTSIVPVLLVEGVNEALFRSNAKLLYVLNLVTKRGQTDRFSAKRFCVTMEHYIGPARLHHVLVNNTPLPGALLAHYASEEEFPVVDDLTDQETFQVHRGDLITGEEIPVTRGDRLRRSLLRHDSDKLARAVLKIL